MKTMISVNKELPIPYEPVLLFLQQDDLYTVGWYADEAEHDTEHYFPEPDEPIPPVFVERSVAHQSLGPGTNVIAPFAVTHWAALPPRDDGYDRASAYILAWKNGRHGEES